MSTETQNGQQEGDSATIKIEAVEGIIGFFDILGFKNYLKNDPNVGSKHALETILKIKTEVPGKLKKRFGDALMGVTWNVMSDTIVLSIPYPNPVGGNQNLMKNERLFRWYALIYAAIALADHMFDQGLPIRGAISHGKYFVHDNSLAGKSIVDAQTLEQKLNLSAVAICAEAEKEFAMLHDETTSMPELDIFPYLVPLKGEMQKLLVLNQWALNDTHLNSDIPQLVAQAFWKHDKDIDAGAHQKFQNTEMLLRYVVARRRGFR